MTVVLISDILKIKISFSFKGTRWIPHVERALHVLLKEGGEEQEDSGQYAATLQHMSHLAATCPSAEIKGRAKKVIRLIMLL